MCGNCDIVPADTLDPFEVRQLEKELVKLDPKFMDVVETLHGGLYTRSAKVKRGEILIGACHKTKNFFHVVSGKVAIWDQAHGLRIITGPHSEICRDGTQRVGVALSDVECLNIMETECVTVQAAEAAMIHPFTLPTGCAGLMLRIVRAVFGPRGKIQLKL